MKKLLAYSIWLIVSLLALAVLKNIVTYEFQKYSAIIMGVAYVAVIYFFIVIRGRFSKVDRRSEE